MRILGIETSCDETAASLIETKGDKIKVVSSVVSSQINIHKKYGGVVPEVAARNHITKIIPVINQAIKKLKTKPDVVAVTNGPGLIPALIIGLETAKALAFSWSKPLIGVNHLAGHIYSAFLPSPQTATADGTAKQKVQFPVLALLVSGGHTELVLMKNHFNFQKLGSTRDDAVGEAFDKVAKILGLGYPGGPEVAKRAQKTINHKSSIINLKLPRPMMYDKSFDFSFSGLKTAVLYHQQKNKNWQKQVNDYCAAFQQAAIDVLIFKALTAAKQYQVKSVILAGGVAANLELRKQLKEKIKQELPTTTFHVPGWQYTTDNAAMIAAAGYYQLKYGGKKNKQIKVESNDSL